MYPAFPYPSFTQVSREDSDALYAFLRSVPAVDRANTPHALRFPYSTQAALAVWRALYFRPGGFEPDPGQSAEWNRGKYLTQGRGLSPIPLLRCPRKESVIQRVTPSAEQHT